MTRSVCVGVPALALLVCAAPASASTITFGTASDIVLGWTEAGYLVERPGGAVFIIDSASCLCADNGTFYAAAMAPGTTFVITRVGGGAFLLNGFQGAELGVEASSDWAAGIQVTGTRADFTTAVMSFALDQLNDGTGGNQDFQFFPPTLFDYFISLEFAAIPGILTGGDRFSIDNVVLYEQALEEPSQVPEPATLLLLGGGLAMVARRLRRSSTASTRAAI